VKPTPLRYLTERTFAAVLTWNQICYTDTSGRSAGFLDSAEGEPLWTASDLSPGSELPTAGSFGADSGSLDPLLLAMGSPAGVTVESFAGDDLDCDGIELEALLAPVVLLVNTGPPTCNCDA